MSQPLDLQFQSHGFLTLGVELELQLIDWRTKDLCPAAPRILAAFGGETDRVKPEIFQSMLEICTGVCGSVDEVAADLGATRARLLQVCEELGVDVVGAGTHPFARSEARLIYPSERYRLLIDRNQFIARRLAIFGLHVHVGVKDGDQAMAISNGLVGYLAHLLALSASSPFLEGQDTGLCSARSTIFESQPTAGTPQTFGSWAAFADFSQRAQRGGSIGSLKDLWWDLRPNPGFGTIEIRICDGSARLGDTLGLVALVQSLVAHLAARLEAGEPLPAPSPWRLRDNKWRATRWGLDAQLLLDEEGQVSPLRDQVRELLDTVGPQAQALGSAGYLDNLRRVLTTGGSVARQRAVYDQTRSFGTVVEALAREWREDVDVFEF